MATTRNHGQQNMMMLLLQQGIDEMAEYPDGQRILRHYLEQALDSARRRAAGIAGRRDSGQSS